MARPNLSEFTGTNDKEAMYKNSFVDTNLVSGKEKLPTGEKGFNLWKLMRRVGSKHVGLSPLQSKAQPNEEDPSKHENYGAVQINNWVEGWAKYVEDTFGHRNAFAAMAVAGKDAFEDAVQSSEGKAETVLEKVATKTLGPDGQKDGPVDSGVVQNATPILIDPDFLNTLRSAAPILDWVDVVAQAGFTAAFNVVSGRDQMLNWASESEVRDLSGETGEAFTLENSERDMKIGYGMLDVSDFAAQAQSSLNFMDLEGTSMEVWLQGYAVEEAEAIFYANPDGGLSDGSSHDSEAITGLHATAAGADSSYTTDVSGESLDGDKPLFNRIKEEVLSLVKDSGATIPNLGIATSLDVFHEMENEANVNVRLDSFDQGINFGRDPMGPTTLSISGVPVLPEPNIRDYNHGSGEYDGDHGDVFIFERPNVQRRALQPLSSTNLGQLGLANRIVNYQYEALVDRSQGHHTRVLEGFNVPELGA